MNENTLALGVTVIALLILVAAIIIGFAPIAADLFTLAR